MGRPPPNAVPGWAHPRVRCRGRRRAEGLTITPAGLPLGHLEGRRFIVQVTSARTERPWPFLRQALPRVSFRISAENGHVTRLIAGIAGGRRIEVPPGKGTRPTSDRAREGIFSTVGSLAGAAGAGGRPLRRVGAPSGSNRSAGDRATRCSSSPTPRRCARSGPTSRRWACRARSSWPTGSSGWSRARARASPTTSCSPTRPTRSPTTSWRGCWSSSGRTAGSADGPLVAVERETRGNDLRWPPRL